MHDQLMRAPRGDRSEHMRVNERHPRDVHRPQKHVAQRTLHGIQAQRMARQQHEVRLGIYEQMLLVHTPHEARQRPHQFGVLTIGVPVQPPQRLGATRRRRIHHHARLDIATEARAARMTTEIHHDALIGAEQRPASPSYRHDDSTQPCTLQTGQVSGERAIRTRCLVPLPGKL